MAASFTRGTTFVAGQEVDSADLLALLTAAAVEGIDRSDRATNEPAFFSTADTSPPGSLAVLESWYNTNTGWLLTRVAAPAGPASCLPGGILVTASGAISAGQVVAPLSYDGTTLTVAVIPAATRTFRAFGVAAQDIADGSTGILIVSGTCRIKVASNASIGPGQTLKVSGIENGVVTTVNVRGSGVGPEGFATSYRSQSGGYVWALLWK